MAYQTQELSEILFFLSVVTYDLALNIIYVSTLGLRNLRFGCLQSRGYNFR